MSRAPHLLLVLAPYYAHIAAMLRQGAEQAIAAAGATCEIAEVPGAFELPPAIAHAARSVERFDGYVALGCVIRGETHHFEIVANESARALMDLSVRERLPVGNGIITVENEAQAHARAKVEGEDKGGHAARAALTMVALKQTLVWR